MSPAKFILRSLRFYWRTNIGVALGAALATAILAGALAVGDSVRHTLQQLARARLGDTELAMVAADRFFRATLADELAAALAETHAPPTGAPEPPLVAPLLLLRGTVSVSGRADRAHDVQVVGVDPRFWRLGPGNDPLAGARPDEVILNERLARRLDAQPGERIFLRVQRPTYVPRDAPLSGEVDAAVMLRARVRAVAGDDQFGRFSLQANQVTPLTVFVPLTTLQTQLQRDGRANVLLTGQAGIGVEQANAALRKLWRLSDADLEWRELPDRNAIELRTDRVFLEPAVAGPAMALAPDAYGALTYFVNETRVADRVAWYSVVAAVDTPILAAIAANTDRPADEPPLADDQIIFNTWLAEDIEANVGDMVTLRYYVAGDGRRLEQQQAVFRLRAVAPIQAAAADAELLPNIPGLYGTRHCGEWAPGVPINLDNLREKDQEYWETYGGTPKAFITLRAGQRIWQNRFGNLTAIRYPMQPGRAVESLAAALRQQLEPATLGLFFQPVREQALRAGRESMDFGQLFVGFSFFLIAAALLLMAMLFVLNLEQRHEEIGVLLATGFTPARARRWLLAEGFALALAGTAAGVAAGAAYTNLALRALAAVWQHTDAAVTFQYHVEPVTLLAGALAGLVAAMLAIWLAVRNATRRPAAQLLAQGAEPQAAPASPSRRRQGSPRPFVPRRNAGLWVFVAAVAGAVVVLTIARAGHAHQAAGAFFGAGALLLAGGIGLCHWWLTRLARITAPSHSLAAVGARNATRRRGRSLTTAGVLACGVFMVVAVNAFRHDPLARAHQRDSGTGGFALFAQSALPIHDDLNSETGRDRFGLDEAAMAGVEIVPLRLREGDDASCLNLHRVLQPQIFGVQPDRLHQRGAFVFAGLIERGARDAPWLLLERPGPDGAVPAIGDAHTVTWALGKKLGDTLPYTDDRGTTFQIRIVGVLANSILQGGLLISERNFVQRFPSATGHRLFLIDAPPDRAAEVAESLEHALRDWGWQTVPAWQRLAEFLAIEHAYLGIFQALGGLGLLLGSVGLGIVVLRNVLERRGELALLQAVGFRRSALRRLVLSEHWMLLALGLLCGVGAALVAVAPSLAAPGAQVPYLPLAVALAAILVSGMLWIWLAAVAALRSRLLPALRNE